MEKAASIDYQPDSLQVAGDLNFVTVVALWRDSLAKLSRYAVLSFDMGKVSACNSAGLALMLEWVKYAKQTNKKIVFKHISKNIASIIQVAGVNSLLPQEG